ncbi:MAG: YfiR family protein [Sedimentisphaerales bacterium]|nr:YfiR family protein [Sedimentisphaerales bacterium]
MKTWTCAPLLTVVLLLGASIPTTVRADEASEREYQLKAAFLYNFIMFIDSPRLAPPDEADRNAPQARKPILIGIIGKDPFGAAFEPLKNKEVRDRPVVVKRFKGLELPVDTDDDEKDVFGDLEAVRQCHVLFICASEQAHLKAVLGPLKGHSVLTVSDVPGFLEAGGMVNFIIEDKKVRFEINTGPAEQARLAIRSKLLRLAQRVIKKDLGEGQTDGGNEPPSGDQ